MGEESRATRLAGVLAEWQAARAAGRAVDPETFLGAHPDLAEELGPQLAALEVLDDAMFDAEESAAEVPRQIGEFRILHEIGRGGMGVVYAAEQGSMKRRVALKVLKASITGVQRAVKRFKIEARAAGSLHHTNIVPVYGMGQHAGYWYYAMELVEGRPLSSIVADLRTSGKRETSELRERISGSSSGTGDTSWYRHLAEMFAGVAEALQLAHEQGIIHRDVKPSNLLLDQDGVLKVVDFGLAHLVGQGLSMTMTGDLLGTPAYMSPEQAMAKRIELDHRTDVYSLGATLYEVLTLSPPFAGRNLQAICSQIITKDPALPRRIEPHVPRDLETIVLKAMEKDRDKRFTSARELARDLQRFAAGEAVAARRTGPVGRAWRKVLRHRLVSSLAAAALFAALVGSLGIMTQTARASSARRDATDQRHEAEREAATKLAIYEFLHEMLTGFEASGRETTVSEMLDQASARIADALPEDPLVEADVRDMIRAMYDRLGLYERAEPHARRVIEIRELELGPDDASTLEALFQLAWNQMEQGKSEEAEPLLRRVFEARLVRLGEDEEPVLVTKRVLAMSIAKQGRLAEAERMLREVVQTRRQANGDDDPMLASGFNDLGLVVLDLGWTREAIELLRDSLERERRSGEEPDKDMLRCMHNLGLALMDAGELDEAAAVFSEALDGRRALLGDDHVDTLRALQFLATIHTRRKAYPEAIAAYEDILAVQRSRFGDAHPNVAEALKNYAVDVKAHDIELAERLAWEALEVYHQLPFARPADHRHATDILYGILLETGDAEERIAMLREALAFQRENVEPGHLALNVVLTFLGTELLEQGEYAESEALLRQALSIAEHHWLPGSPDHWVVHDKKSLLGAALTGLGHYEEAEMLLVDSYDALLASTPVRADDPEKLADAREAAGRRVLQLYESWGRPEVAEAMREEYSISPDVR